MADSCYEESDVGESSEYGSSLDSDDMEVKVDLAKLVDLAVPEDQDFGESSTQIPHEENTPPADEEAIHSADEDNTLAIMPYKGQLFETLEDAKAFYLTYARKTGFGVRTRDSRREKVRDNTITRLHLVCVKPMVFLLLAITCALVYSIQIETSETMSAKVGAVVLNVVCVEAITCVE